MSADFWARLLPWAPLWTIEVSIFVTAIFLALVVHSIVFAILKRLFRNSDSLLHAIILRSSALARFAFIIVAISAVLPAAPMPADVSDSVHKVLLAAFVVFVGWAIIFAVNLALDRYTRGLRLDVADNLEARKALTQLKVFKRAIDITLIVLTAGFAMMSFDSVRQFGVSLFASAGVAGIAAGLAARPVLGNLFAGMQIAITQPIRLDDILVINGQNGRVEEITSTYVVMRLWDWRRYIVPLSYFFDNPFENWTRSSTNLIGSVYLHVDYSVPVERVRQKLDDIVRKSSLWDGEVASLQMSDAKDNTVELRALVSASSSARAWDLRCEVREKLIGFLQLEYPEALPLQRTLTLAPRLGPAQA